MDAIAHVPDVSEIAHLPGVSQIANYVITFIKDQIGYISSYEENLEKLMTEVQRLKDTQDGVQHRVVEAKRNGEKIENIVQNWLKKANEIVAAANKVIDVDGTRWCLGQYCPYLWTRCQLSKSFEKMTKEILDVIKKAKFDNRFSYRDAPDVTITPLERGYETLESRTSMLNEIKEILKDPKMYVIGVHGMGGVGKTTLVNELAWQVKKDGLFGAVAIADITNSQDVKKIQGQIADALDLKLEKESERGRATELRQRIKKEEKVLIILDDIWSELNLTEVGIPFGDEHNGCKLVITSREREVLTKMNTKKYFNLTALLEEDSWNLFQKIAGNVVNEVSIKPIAEEVAKCCAGLPLLIAAVAKGLIQKEVHAWRVALTKLKKFKHKELENIVYPALKLSYDNLDTEELKSLFLFIGSFGLNEMLTEDLFICCWGWGFYGGVDKLMDARDTHYALINELRASSLLLEGELGWVRMHDVVRDVAKSIASESPPTDPTYPTYIELSNLEILSLAKSSFAELPGGIKHLTRLRLLNLTDCSSLRVIPTNLISSLMCLEELYMGGCNNIEWEVEGSKSESDNANVRELQDLHNLTTLEISFIDTSVLPMDFQFPANLERYNILIGSWALSSIWYGGALERTLKLTDYWWTSRSLFTTVEDLSFAKLKGVKDLLYDLDVEGFPQLKHLYIQDTDELLHLINPRRLVNPHSAFLNLETLVLDDLCKMEEICHGPMQTQFFAKLKVIEVTSCDGLKNLFLYSLTGNLSQLHEIEISSCEGMTEIIAVEKQEDQKELLQIDLPELHSVTLRGLPELQSFYCSVTVDQSIPLALFNQQVVTPKLETLKLYDMNLCKIWDDKLPVVSCFQNLTSLIVYDCNRLISLFPSGVPEALVKLECVEISRCKRMKAIFAQKEGQFPNSETVEMSIKNDRESIRPNQVPPNSFHHKLKIDISGCESMDFVFPISAATELRQHQFLEIRSCGIKNIFEKSDSTSDMTHVYLEKIIVERCTGMKTVIPSCVLFQCLDELIVFSCHTLLNIIRPSTTTSLPKLRILRIRGCNELEEICGSSNEGDGAVLDEIAFMKLEELTLNNLPRLRSFCQGSYDFRFPSLQIVRLENCPMMETFCQGNITTPSLTEVEYGSYDYRHMLSDGPPNSFHCMDSTGMKKITVEKCTGMKTIIPSCALFQCLDELIVFSCHTLVNIIRPSTTSLPKLRILRIWDCNELEEICGSSNEGDAPVLDEIAFMKLEELTLECLPRLTSFCQGSYHFRFPSLQIVRLIKCPMMETFCQGNITTPSLTKVEYESYDFRHTSEDHRRMLSDGRPHMMRQYNWYGDLNTTVRTVFTKKYRDMEKLVIRRDNCNWKFIWPNQVTPNSFPNLTQIDISSCEGQYVFPIHVAKVLRKLQVLEISCCTIENIVEESDSTCDMTVVYLQVRYCHNMMTIVPSSVQFYSLDELHVTKCRGLVNIIMPSTIANLPNLRILSIKYCFELEEIYGSNNESDEPLGEIAFMKLEELTLKSLRSLTSFCQGSYSFNFPSLQKVQLKDCPVMETFCHGNLTTTSHIEVRCLYGSSNEESEDHWDGNLNTTIRTIFTKEVHINQTSGS
ncbi:hypothetical protein GLYMA_15G246100v4 [Glycine max]|nr:hypothetical protein GLYMA_15G246100v4 [Glycine max]